MKPELQRIKIAEACGIKRVDCPLSTLGGSDPHHPAHGTFWFEDGWDGPIGLYDYLGDLNAMACAWKHLTTDVQRMEFRIILSHVVWRDAEKTGNAWFEGATAAQWAESFLRTLKLWEEETT